MIHLCRPCFFSTTLGPPGLKLIDPPLWCFYMEVGLLILTITRLSSVKS